MSNVFSRRARRHACFTALVIAIAIALVAVPTIMRARQHVELRDATRLSIRLNWQSAAPPQKPILAPDSASAVVPIALAQQPHPARVTPRVHALDEPVTRPLFDNSPDLLRGPPASRSPHRTASAAC